ncbi:MAG: hypothetical protein RIS99_422, partial [Bacteroidota bacterium]
NFRILCWTLVNGSNEELIKNQFDSYRITLFERIGTSQYLITYRNHKKGDHMVAFLIFSQFEFLIHL